MKLTVEKLRKILESFPPKMEVEMGVESSSTNNCDCESTQFPDFTITGIDYFYKVKDENTLLLTNCIIGYPEKADDYELLAVKI